MATFIKAGFWEQLCKPCKGYKGWLNLDEFVESRVVPGPPGPQGPIGPQGPTGPAGGLFSQTVSSTPVTNTIVETSLISTGVGSLSVPANGFSVGDSFKATIIGHLSCNSSATITIKIKSGSVILADTGVIALSASTNKHYKLDIHFTIRTIGAATVASIVSGGSFSFIKNASTNFEGTDFSVINNTTFDTTILNTLNVTVQWGAANAANTIYSELFTLTKTY